MMEKGMAFKVTGVLILTALLAGSPAAAQGEAAPAAESITANQGQEPILLTVAGAVLESLKNNKAWIVQTFEPQITRTFEDEALSVFDPVLNGEISQSADRAPSVLTDDYTTTDSTVASLSLNKMLTTGATVGLEANAQGNDASAGTGTTTLTAKLNQPLLRGAFPKVNLVSLQQARLDSRISDYEVRGFAVTLVAQVEEAYWDYSVAMRNIAIVEDSLFLSRRQLEETLERIRIGKLAAVERMAAEAEVALRQVDLINARSARESARLALLRLVSPSGGELWDRAVGLSDEPEAALQGEVAPVDDYVRTAMRLRPDLNQARLQMERGDLELIKTSNGLLPKLDLFINLGKTGYSDSFGRSMNRVEDEGFDITAGLTVQFPFFNRAAEADNRRASLTRQQSEEAMGNLTQLAQVDVRKAHIEVRRLSEQISASAASRRLQEEKYRAETEKFRVGRSTSFLVSQAERDLLQSRVAEAQATVGYLKALVELYRLDGSILDRRGIQTPGDRPGGSGSG
ncbi:MAG: TolC family protein [Syntrophales bacterium]|nr:TolC family protein [Syntrophales bacterium]